MLVYFFYNKVDPVHAEQFFILFPVKLQEGVSCRRDIRIGKAVRDGRIRREEQPYPIAANVVGHA